MEAGGGRLMFRRSCEAQTLCVCCNQSDAPWELAGAGELLLGGRLLSVLPGRIQLDAGGYCLVTGK